MALPLINDVVINTINYLGPVLGIAIAIITSLYFSGHILRNEKMKEKALSMLWDVIIFFAVLIFLTDQLLYIASSIAKDLNQKGYNAYCLSIAGTPGIDIDKHCHILIARGYLNTLVSEGFSFFESIFASYRVTKIAESIQIVSKSENVDRTKIIGKTASAYNYVIEVYMGYMQTVIIVSLMQLYFFDFFVKTFPLFFSLGIILRAMPLTKKIGGLLIAISLCTFIFMPLIISIVDIYYENIPQSLYSGFRLNRAHNPALGLGAIVEFDFVDPTTGNVIPSSQISNIVQTPIVNQPPSSVSPINPSTYPNPLISPTTITNIYSNAITTSSTTPPTAPTTVNINPPSPTIGQQVGDNIWAFIKLFSFISAVVPTFGVYTGQIVAKYIGSAVGMYAGGPLGSVLGGVIGTLIAGGTGALVSGGLIVSGFHIVTITMFSIAEVMSNFIVFSGMFAYITLISTIGAIKALSEFLGGEIEIAGLTSFL